jgi:type I restriction enzyme S subunit
MSGWQTKQLGAVLQLNYGKGFSVENRSPGSIPVYESNGIVGFHNSALVEGPRVIDDRNGSTGEAHLCSGAFYPLDTTYYITHQDAPEADIEFHYNLPKHLDLQRSKGEVGVSGLNREMACFEPVSQHSGIPELKAIAHSLSTLERAIDAQERMIQTTTEQKKVLMQKLFTEGLRGEPQKETVIGLMPESWGVVPFEKFATLQRSFDLRKQEFRPGKVPVIGATQVIGYHDPANLKGPGVTVVRSGSSAGMPQYIQSDFWAHNVLLHLKDFHGNIPKFVYHKIMSLDLTRFRQGVAVPTLNRNTFSSIEISVPPCYEQKEIVHVLDRIEQRCHVAARHRHHLQDLFMSLLRNLLNSKMRVTIAPLPSS